MLGLRSLPALAGEGRRYGLPLTTPDVILAAFPGFSPLPLAPVGSFFVSTKWGGAAVLGAAF